MNPVVENDITGEKIKKKKNNFMDKNLLTLTTKMTVLF